MWVYVYVTFTQTPNFTSNPSPRPILTPPTPPPQPNPTPRQLLPPNSILACSSLEKTLALKLNPVPKLTTALKLNPNPKPSSSITQASLFTIAWTWALPKIGNCLEVLLSEKIKKNRFKSLTYLRELSHYSLFPPPLKKHDSRFLIVKLGWYGIFYR